MDIANKMSILNCGVIIYNESYFRATFWNMTTRYFSTVPSPEATDILNGLNIRGPLLSAVCGKEAIFAIGQVSSTNNHFSGLEFLICSTSSQYGSASRHKASVSGFQPTNITPSHQDKHSIEEKS
jgi:hypothetical protein